MNRPTAREKINSINRINSRAAPAPWRYGAAASSSRVRPIAAVPRNGP
ncbi:MAG: hypothetical protein IPN17_24535 [Deltaproteobacteria bacterium]|nr:hypothetical protein [Deltaproteobacteria bacterium]MBK8695351.1 hypothetical protein [Deltaproteobacteria bacterium]